MSSRYAVLIKLDGVIIDIRAATRTAIAAVASAELGRIITPEQVPPDVAPSPADALVVLGVTNPDDACAERFDTALATALGEADVLQPVLAGMAELHARGAAIRVLTSQARHGVAGLLPSTAVDLLDLAGADLRTGTPDREGIRTALEALGVPAERAMYIGDTPADVRAARAAGVLAVSAGWGRCTVETLQRAGADLLLTEPGQVGGGLLYLLAGRGPM